MKKQWLLVGSLLAGMVRTVYAPEFDDNVEAIEPLNIDAGDVENGLELKPERHENTDMDVVLNSGKKSSDLILYAGGDQPQEQIQAADDKGSELTITAQITEQSEGPASVSQVANADVTTEVDGLTADSNSSKKLAINTSVQERLSALDPLGKAQLVLNQGSANHATDGYYDQLVACENARNAFNKALQVVPFNEKNIELKKLEYEAAFGRLTEAIKADSITARTWSSFKSFFKNSRVGKYVTEFLAKRKARQIVLNTGIGKAVEADTQNPFSQDQLDSLVRFTKEVTASIKMQVKDKESVEDIPSIIQGQIEAYNVALNVVFLKMKKLDLSELKGDGVNNILDNLLQDLKESSIDQKACAYDIIRQTALLENGQKITPDELENGYEKWLRTFMREVLTNIEGGADHLKDLQNKTVRGLDPDSSEA